ncbi:MAG: DUF3570 domain-containing protein [Methylotenera sp.]|nr:DUF3570 domain-containing protein [Methylotenera sp.]
MLGSARLRPCKAQPKASPQSASLRSLTLAALALPGLVALPAYAADEDSVDFQYSHYQEGKRDVYGLIYNVDTQLNSVAKLPNHLKPIEVDSLHGSAKITLTDRAKLQVNYTQDTWSGATPVSTAPITIGGNRPQYKDVNPNSINHILTGASPLVGDLQGLYFDQNLNPLQLAGYDPDTGQAVVIPASKKNNDKLVHTMGTASPETRKQIDFKYSYEWDEAGVDAGAGLSVEKDYKSRFLNLAGHLDFNQKLTTLNFGFNYANSDTSAKLDPDSLQFYSTDNYDNSYYDFVEIDADGNDVWKILPKKPLVSAGEVETTYDLKTLQKTSAKLLGNRQDWSAQLGVTQILNKDALVEFNMGYTRSAGYLGNPYKLVTLISINPSTAELSSNEVLPIYGSAMTLLEIRPDERNQFNWNLGYKQYINTFNAALHLDYRYSHDDWGIKAHTIQADWTQPLGASWTVTPHLRYYSQSSADFYLPYIKTVQVYDADTSEAVASPLNRAMPKYYSSDQRLSGFGTLSGGLIVNKQFNKGVSLETGLEYYTHKGSLKLGGGGEADFADYDYWTANIALKVDLDKIASLGHSDVAYSALDSRHDHSEHSHHASHAPAGVMFDHVLSNAGDFMVGYRYVRNKQAGGMLHGNNSVNDNTVRLAGCGGKECAVTPDDMTMNMHMLDLMYAPTDWLTLMVMPQWVDMEMNMTPLTVAQTTGHNHGGAVHSHQTGGLGDTGVYGIFKLIDQPTSHLNLSLGVTAPTGDVDVMLRKTNTVPKGTLIHYGMQHGSGTWDLNPSLTYTEESNKFSWGAQVTGTKRLEKRNKSNYALGDIFQSSIWGGYQWANWLTSTVRGVYTSQGSIHGAYPPLISESTGLPLGTQHVGPVDQPKNYGGQFLDVGLGLNLGTIAGSQLSAEWLQPVKTDFNGYQLKRKGSLAVNWNIAF